MAGLISVPFVAKTIKRHFFVFSLTTVLILSMTLLFIQLDNRVRTSYTADSSWVGSMDKIYQNVVSNGKIDQLGIPQSENEHWTQNWVERLDPNTLQLMSLYCRGEILHTVQMANVFPDSKHFVDMPLKHNSSVELVFEEFRRRNLSLKHFNKKYEGKKDIAQEKKRYVAALRRFLKNHFDEPGSDLVPVTPMDFNDHVTPPMIENIKDVEFKEWAKQLHQLWKHLGRVPLRSVQSSFLHPREINISTRSTQGTRQKIIVVPGGRFLESYYWDSYWIVIGLLVSDMVKTAESVLNNLLEYVAEFGFVPNGGRMYYLTRSQPPMLSEMVKLVATTRDANSSLTFNLEYLNYTVPILEKEYSFWMTDGPGGHAVKFWRRKNRKDGTSYVATYILNRFNSNANHPRPESYREDVVIASAIYYASAANSTGFITEAERSCINKRKTSFYNEIIAAAESGWDFSSRWFRNDVDLRCVYTSYILPVDLNSMMYRMERNLMEFHNALGNSDRAEFFKTAAAERAQAIEDILWSEKDQSWKDYDLEKHAHRDVRSISDYSPLWAKAFNLSDIKRVEKVIKSFEHSGLIQAGGVQTTTKISGQQWDSPNAWAPEQDIIIEGLLNVNCTYLASKLAKKWVHNGFLAWKHTGLMYEKYNVTRIAALGSGGEYPLQFGFGWSNGVILK